MKQTRFFTTLALTLITGALTSCSLPFEIRWKSSPEASPTTSPSIAVSPAAPETSAPIASVSPTPSTATFTDLQGVTGEKEITQLAQLGVFEGVSSQFNPQQPITRAEFIRWLVRANNAIYRDDSGKQVRLAESGQATFPDVPPTHPDFRYIQGMINSGFAVGYDEKTFRPDQPLTREEMIAIKSGFDGGGVVQGEFQGDLNTVYVPDWSDRDQISRRFYRAFNTEYVPGSGNGNQLKNADRTFGAIKAFRPKAPVTRAEAALCMSVIGDRARPALGKRSAQEAL